MIFGAEAGDPNGPICAIMVALYITQDSFGTACNLSLIHISRVMEEIKSMLHLDVMTVTGKTLGENLEDPKKNGFYEHCDEILRERCV